jgi:hypothetical protein
MQNNVAKASAAFSAVTPHANHSPTDRISAGEHMPNMHFMNSQASDPDAVDQISMVDNIRHDFGAEDDMADRENPDLPGEDFINYEQIDADMCEEFAEVQKRNETRGRKKKKNMTAEELQEIADKKVQS